MLEKFLTVHEDKFKDYLLANPPSEEDKADTRREAYRYGKVHTVDTASRKF